TKVSEASRQVWTGNLDLPVALGLQPADRAFQIVPDKPCIGADRLQSARNDPFSLFPPSREGTSLRLPVGMVLVPVPHDLVHVATVDTARLSLGLVDEMPEERRVR